jgi:hypothetical protein
MAPEVVNPDTHAAQTEAVLIVSVNVSIRHGAHPVSMNRYPGAHVMDVDPTGHAAFNPHVTHVCPSGV